MSKKKSDGDRLGDCYWEARRIQKKLTSLGSMLEMQNQEDEVVDLEGLGMILSDLGEGLHLIALELDELVTCPDKSGPG
jgi:hypothetical protein